MIYFFDKNYTLLKVENKVKECWRNEEINCPATLNAVVSYANEQAEYIGHKDVINPKQIQLYKIHTATTENDGVHYVGVEAGFDDLKGHYIKDIRPTGKTMREVLGMILTGTGWEAGTITTLKPVTTNFYYISALEALLKMLEVTSTEVQFRYLFDGHQILGRYIDVADQIGQETGKRFVHGSNLLEVEKEENRSELYTALVGRGKGEEKLDEDGEATGGYGRKITFANLKWEIANGDPVDKPIGQEYVELPAMTEIFGYQGTVPRIGIIDFPDIEDKVELLQATYERLVEVSRPFISYAASVRDVGDTGLGDTVSIIRKDLGITYKTRIYAREVNILQPADTKIKLGDQTRSYSQKQISNLKSQIKSVEKQTESLTNTILKFATNQYFGEDGYNYDLKAGNQYNLPAGLYSFDKPIDQNPTKVIYVGAGKMLIANEKNPDGSWKFTTVATGDGFIAENMFAGKLTADIIHMESMTLSEKVSEIEKEIDDIEVTAGKDGKSAYEIAKEKGFDGTEEEWLASLKGETGEPGTKGKDGEKGENGQDGVSVVNTLIEFAIGTEEKPNEAWFESPPATWDAATDYIWQRTKTTYSDGSSETSGVNRLTSTEVKKIFENLHGEIAALEDKLGKSIESLLDEDGVISPLEYADLANTRTQIENEYQVINAKVATGEVKDNLYNKYKALYEILGAIPSAGSSYTAVDSEGLRKAYQEYTEAKAAAEMEIAQAESKRFTDMEAGQISLGSRINAYEEQLRLESGLIAMYLNKGNGLEEAMRLTNEELAFLLNGNKEVWIGLNGLNSERGTFTQLSFGNHKATKQGTDYTVISWIGG